MRAWCLVLQSFTTSPPLSSLQGASVPNMGKFFYYSNDSENVSGGLVDDTPSHMLLGPTPGFPAQVTGSGRVFLWHGNDMNRTVALTLHSDAAPQAAATCSEMQQPEGLKPNPDAVSGNLVQSCTTGCMAEGGRFELPIPLRV